MWSSAENHIPSPISKPPSELLWKHNRILRVKLETSCAVESANLGGTAETCVFRPYLIRMITHFFIENKGAIVWRR